MCVLFYFNVIAVGREDSFWRLGTISNVVGVVSLMGDSEDLYYVSVLVVPCLCYKPHD